MFIGFWLTVMKVLIVMLLMSRWLMMMGLCHDDNVGISLSKSTPYCVRERWSEVLCHMDRKLESASCCR